MPKQLFSGPEMYLVENWADAQLLQESMEEVRSKYKEVLSQVLGRVSAKHHELNRRGMRLKDSGGFINVGIGRDTWPSKDAAYPSGFWLSGVTLDDLASSDADAPRASVFLDPAKDIQMDTSSASARLVEAAKQVLSAEILDRFVCEEPDASVYVYYPLPKSPQDLMELLRKEDAGGFVQCMVDHFETLTKFIPVIDDIYQGADGHRK